MVGVKFEIVIFGILWMPGVLSADCSDCGAGNTSTGCLPPRTATSPGQKWGYFSIRPHAHTFYWLFYSQHHGDYKKRPTILWLQGGPGDSSMALGNLLEIGPLDARMRPRKYTWAQVANLLFVDNPVGAGYSYVTDVRAYTSTLEEVATDMLTFTKMFFKKNPELQDSPLYLFGESYGGKWVVAFAQKLHTAITKGEIKCNLRGIAMGNSLLHARDLISENADFLFQTSVVDYFGFMKIQQATRPIMKAIDARMWKTAGMFLWRMYDIVKKLNPQYDFYNIRRFQHWPRYLVEDKQNSTEKDQYFSFDKLMDQLYRIMNGQIKKKLKLIPKNLNLSGQRAKYVFNSHSGEHLQPVTDTISDLLRNTDLRVTIYQGQWDLACVTPGAEKYVTRLKWPGQKGYTKAERKEVVSDPHSGRPSVFVKAFKNFKFYWIMDAGHMVPLDYPSAAFKMMKRILNDSDR